MYNPQTVKYSFLVNEADANGVSQTMKIVHITGSCTGRCSLFRKFLKHTYKLTRKQANKVIVEFGFDDMIPCPKN